MSGFTGGGSAHSAISLIELISDAKAYKDRLAELEAREEAAINAEGQAAERAKIAAKHLQELQEQTATHENNKSIFTETSLAENKRLAQRQEAIDTWTAHLQQKEDSFSTREESLTAREQAIAVKQDQIAQLDAELSKRKIHLDEVQRELDKRELDLNDRIARLRAAMP